MQLYIKIKRSGLIYLLLNFVYTFTQIKLYQLLIDTILTE